MDTLKQNQYLAFNLAGEIFAINIANVKEVLELPQITHVPRMPNFLSKIFNLRGNIIPLLDLKLKFGIGKTELNSETGIIVTEVSNNLDESEQKNLTIGILCEGGQEVINLEKEQIKPPPRIGITIDTSFLLGMGQLEQGFVLILNIEKLLTKAELTNEKKDFLYDEH